MKICCRFVSSFIAVSNDVEEDFILNPPRDDDTIKIMSSCRRQWENYIHTAVVVVMMGLGCVERMDVREIPGSPNGSNAINHNLNSMLVPIPRTTHILQTHHHSPPMYGF